MGEDRPQCLPEGSHIEISILTFVFALWIVALLTLPLWIYVLGRGAARLRERLEAPHRHPRPAVDLLAPGRHPAVSRRPAFEAGVAATAGARVRRVEDLPRVLAKHHGLNGVVVPDPTPEVPFRVVFPTTSAEGSRVAAADACQYDRGLVAGLFRAALRLPVLVDESACAARGADHCAFDVRVEPLALRTGRSTARRGRAGSWASRLMGRVPAGAALPSAPRERASGAADAAAQAGAQRSRMR